MPSSLLIRALTGTDREALAAAFERIGEESRYRRFLCATPRLTQSQLRYLTEVDQREHVALATVVGSEIVGVARFVRLEGSDAEPAIAVVDEWQGRGVGSALMAALAARAREQGVTRYRATVLARNEATLRLLADAGDMCWSAAGSELLVTVDLAPGRVRVNGCSQLEEVVTWPTACTA